MLTIFCFHTELFLQKCQCHSQALQLNDTYVHKLNYVHKLKSVLTLSFTWDSLTASSCWRSSYSVQNKTLTHADTCMHVWNWDLNNKANIFVGKILCLNFRKQIMLNPVYLSKIVWFVTNLTTSSAFSLPFIDIPSCCLFWFYGALSFA